jgi:hypothetical protein
METGDTPVWRLSPHPKQWDLIDCAADIAIYGGGAGGGKSFALLAEPICRGLHEVKGFSAVVFRRTAKQIKEAGALWDQAGKIYPYVGGAAHVGDSEYRFPSGARIAFRNIENEEDKHNYAGSEICYLAFDELYTFTESQFTFLLSRNRSVCGVAPYVRATSNPHPGWLRTYLAPWVHDEFQGQKAQSGEIRHQLRVKGKIQWVPEGTPHAKSVTFIRAMLADNPTLYEGDPSYEATLRAGLPIEQERLLYGNWSVISEGLVYPEALDPAYECLVEKEDRYQKPDVGGMDYGIRNPFVAIWGYVRAGPTIPDHAKELPEGVEWWCDPSGSEQIAQLKDFGHDARPCVHRPSRGADGETKNPLNAGIDMVRNRMRTGRLKIVRSQCRELIRELGLYVYDIKNPEKETPLKKDDHSMDALRYLITGVDRGSYGEEWVPPESEADRVKREEKEKADAKAELLRRKALDESRERSIFEDTRWGNT